MTYFLTLYIITSTTHCSVQYFPQNWKRLTLCPFIKRRANLISKILLPVISKVYEKCMFDQMYNYFNQILSKQCGFRQGHSSQHSLLLMVEKLKKNLGNSDVGGILDIDLSKAFYCLRHDLLIAKLAAYDFDKSSLCFIFNYLLRHVRLT